MHYKKKYNKRKRSKFDENYTTEYRITIIKTDLLLCYIRIIRRLKKRFNEIQKSSYNYLLVNAKAKERTRKVKYEYINI